MGNNTVRTSRKGGAPLGNKNAVGNSGGGAPKGNRNAWKHGGYAAVAWDTLTEEEWEMIATMPSKPEDLLEAEIDLLIVRERRIMHIIKWLDDAPKGLMVACVTRSEMCREFADDEEQRLYEERIAAAVDRLPGHPYRITTAAEAVHNIILRFEEILTRCQGEKLKCLQLLNQIRSYSAGERKQENNLLEALREKEIEQIARL